MGGGPAATRAMAQRLGIRSPVPNNASVALGTAEVTLLELTAAYAAMVNGGRRVTPHGIRELVSEGRTQPMRAPPPAVAISAETAAAMRRMMVAVVTSGTGRQAALRGAVTGGKTGTTQDYKDAWFIGFFEGVVIGVWLGNDRGEPMEQVRGGTMPARLFREVIDAAR